ncbi:MAG: hypothetical protein HY331_01315 [Chloroflexi bacterium]|nr:hypothetical protein [Chloroflexota bacterium]
MDRLLLTAAGAQDASASAEFPRARNEGQRSLLALSYSLAGAVLKRAVGQIRLPIGAPLMAALLTGFVIWAIGPARPGIRASSGLPYSEPGRQRMVAAIWNGDRLNQVPREAMAVAVLRGGDVLVADVGLGQVHRFDADGRLRRSYSGGVGFRYPVALAVAEDDRVWVADLWGERLYRLNLTNDTVAEVPPASSGYRAPGAIAYRNGLLYVADLVRHQVLVLTPDGGLVRIVGSGRGEGPGELAFPNGVWAGEAGDVYVADTNNARIQVFDAEGRLTRILQPHRLLLPRGIVQDRRGNLHVADTLSHDIAVLDPAGRIVARYGAEVELALPNGLALRGDMLYAADRRNGRVIVWELGDE